MIGGINMITKNNLDKIEKWQNKGCILTTNILKEFGFHIGEIAYLIETGRLIQNQDGSYEYLGTIRQNVLIDNSLNQKYSGVQSPGVLLSILHKEIERIEIDTKDPDWKFLEEKSRLLERKKGVVILKPMSEERRNKIHSFVRAIPCLEVLTTIDNGAEKQKMVLKFHIDTQVDVKDLINSGDKAYSENKFRKCIRYYLEAFSHLRKPSPYLCGRLGISYMKIGQTRNAVGFLTIADSLYKKRGKKREFSGLIEELNRKNMKKEDRKYFVPFEESEFENKTDDCFGLNAIEEMTAFVSSGKSVEEVANMFSLGKEQIMIFLLLLAKNSYTEGSYSSGDAYLKQVERQKNKTEQVKKLLDEIRKNKRFYKNRREEKQKILF